MLKRLLIGILTLVIVTATQPKVVLADVPHLTVNFQGMDLNTNTDWLSTVPVNSGDRVRLRLVVTNTGGETAGKMLVRSYIFDSNASIQYPSVHLAYNYGVTPDAALIIKMGNSSSMALEYIPGTTSFTLNGAGQNVSSDTADANIMTRQISLGDIPVGSSATVLFDISINGNPGPVPMASASGTATSSAVASSSPKTGVGDAVWWSTCGWLAVGAVGIAIRKWAMGILV